MTSGTMQTRHTRLESVQGCSSCRTRTAFVQRRGASRPRKEHVRDARSVSRWQNRHLQPTCVTGARNVALPSTAPSAAMQENAITTEKASDLVPGGREFFQWILDLPWNRLAVWLAVAWFTYQLKDFFGVRGHHPPSLLREPPFWD